jgi:hypothetical protein
MSKLRSEYVQLRDPLSDVTRRERRALLGVSAIGIVIAKTGLVPSKISALGIEFTQADQRSLLLSVAAIISYFLIAFIVYAASDFLAWRLSYGWTLIDEELEKRRLAKDVDEKERNLKNDIIEEYRLSEIWFTMSKPMSIVRAVFEFAIPIALGAYAVIVLVSTRV